jgi:hypothetical protein
MCTEQLVLCRRHYPLFSYNLRGTTLSNPRCGLFMRLNTANTPITTNIYCVILLLLLLLLILRTLDSPISAGFFYRLWKMKTFNFRIGIDPMIQ